MTAKKWRQQCKYAKQSQHLWRPSVGLFASLLFLIAWIVTCLRTVDAGSADVDDPQFYLYLKEDPASVRPVDEYKSSDPKTDVDKRRPDFIYDPSYPNHRIVEFYAHWCPHCQHFKPIYIKFARAMDDLLNSINDSTGGAPAAVEYHAISCVPNTKLCKDQNVRGYPHVKYYTAGSNEGKIIKHFELHPLTMIRLFNIPTTPGGESGSHGQEQPPLVGQIDNNHNLRLPNQGQKNALTPNYFMDRGSQEEIFNDAHLSFDFTMRTAIYSSSETLDGDKKKTLKDFLVLLQRTLPPTSSMQPVVNELLGRFDTEVIQGDTKLTAILDENAIASKNNEWSNACKQHGTGYTCGLWLLFHMITVGFVEWNTYVTVQEWSSINPMKAADTIRDFVLHFFLCEECRMHFVNEYDSCSYERCNRLVDHGGNGDSANNKAELVHKHWIQFPLWLYETHNGVNTRLHNERLELRKKQAEEGNIQDEIDYDSSLSDNDVMWPPMNICPSCWLSPPDGRWDEENVYRYMRLTYWPEDYKSAEFRRILLKDSSDLHPPLPGISPPKMDAIQNENEREEHISIKDRPSKTRNPPVTATGDGILSQLKNDAVTYQRGLKLLSGGLILFAILLYYQKQKFVRRGLHKKV